MTDNPLIWCLLIALRILCLFICFQEGGLLYKVREWVAGQLYRAGVPDWVEKMLYAGLACMSGFWGGMLMLKDYYLGWWGLDTMMCVAGMLAILGNFINQKPESDDTKE